MDFPRLILLAAQALPSLLTATPIHHCGPPECPETTYQCPPIAIALVISFLLSTERPSSKIVTTGPPFPPCMPRDDISTSANCYRKSHNLLRLLLNRQTSSL
ncbi:hypothetical protein B0H34DRAFT_718369 [Crassisporium funariophilum]|nr:hypothetical protein B0H34DRAFT_718369 [Crassisporium funariophilum]